MVPTRSKLSKEKEGNLHVLQVPSEPLADVDEEEEVAGTRPDGKNQIGNGPSLLRQVQVGPRMRVSRLDQKTCLAANS